MKMGRRWLPDSTERRRTRRLPPCSLWTPSCYTRSTQQARTPPRSATRQNARSASYACCTNRWQRIRALPRLTVTTSHMTPPRSRGQALPPRTPALDSETRSDHPRSTSDETSTAVCMDRVSRASALQRCWISWDAAAHSHPALIDGMRPCEGQTSVASERRRFIAVYTDPQCPARDRPEDWYPDGTEVMSFGCIAGECDHLDH
jgi:Zn ribbon nucleic-acid-binding protein